MTDSINKFDLVAFREGVPEDHNFVYATMLRGLFYGDSYLSEVPKRIFMENYHNVVTEILFSPDTLLRVACLKNDPDIILGYALISKDETVIKFLFCKKAWRGIGIAHNLLPNTIMIATHLTTIGRAISRSKGWIYNPFYEGEDHE